MAHRRRAKRQQQQKARKREERLQRNFDFYLATSPEATPSQIQRDWAVEAVERYRRLAGDRPVDLDAPRTRLWHERNAQQHVMPLTGADSAVAIGRSDEATEVAASVAEEPQRPARIHRPPGSLMRSIAEFLPASVRRGVLEPLIDDMRHEIYEALAAGDHARARRLHWGAWVGFVKAIGLTGVLRLLAGLLGPELVE